jgi:mannose-6-phosphate isomerase-like protein (cupin superfamily)
MQALIKGLRLYYAYYTSKPHATTHWLMFYICMMSDAIENNQYNIHLDVKFGHQEQINLPEFIKNEVNHHWFNQTLTRVNDSVVRVGVFEEGEFHWHKHDNDDEFFFVLEGKFMIDLEDKTIELNPWQGATITKGVMHRPRAIGAKTVVLMVETASIVPTGD